MKPRIIIAQVEGSGTGDVTNTLKVTGSRTNAPVTVV